VIFPYYLLPLSFTIPLNLPIHLLASLSLSPLLFSIYLAISSPPIPLTLPLFPPFPLPLPLPLPLNLDLPPSPSPFLFHHQPFFCSPSPSPIITPNTNKIIFPSPLHFPVSTPAPSAYPSSYLFSIRSSSPSFFLFFFLSQSHFHYPPSATIHCTLNLPLTGFLPLTLSISFLRSPYSPVSLFFSLSISLSFSSLI
jgi:hypothetical protein